MKKIYLVLVSFVILTMIIACSPQEEETSSKTAKENFNPEGDQIVDENIKLEMMGPSNPLQTVPWSEMKLFTTLEEKTNISFEFNTPSSESMDEKLNLAFASDDLPDILFGIGFSREQEAKFGSEGQLIPLEGLIDDHAPNLQRILKEKPEVVKSITAADGHIYSLPFVDSDVGFLSYQKLWINQSWLDKLDLEMPETIDDLYIVLKAFKEQDPNGNGKADEIPIAGSKDVNVLQVMLNAFGFTGDIDVATGSVRYAPIEKEYKDYLSFMKKLYQDGLYDSESFTQDKQHINAKGANEQVGVFYDAGPFLTVGIEQNEDYVALNPLTSKVNNEKMAARTPLVQSGAFAITSANEHPEATIRWIDFIYSDEGSMFYHYGVEGEDYEYIDEKQGVQQLIPEGMERDEFISKLHPLGILHPRTHDLIQELMLHKQEVTDPQDAHIMKETTEKIKPFSKPSFPNVHFTSEEIQKLNSIRTDIEDYVVQMQAQFITGMASLNNDWNEYIDNLQKMQVEEFINIHTDAYERWKSVE